jgi:hypothetical protein
VVDARTLLINVPHPARLWPRWSGWPSQEDRSSASSRTANHTSAIRQTRPTTARPRYSQPCSRPTEPIGGSAVGWPSSTAPPTLLTCRSRPAQTYTQRATLGGRPGRPRPQHAPTRPRAHRPVGPRRPGRLARRRLN